MPNSEGIREITAPVEFAVVGDRLQFVLHSGECSRSFSISFHRARVAAMLAVAMLDAHDRATAGAVKTMRKRPPAKH